MQRFEKVTDGIYRLRVPFENIYTSVFLIDVDGRHIIVDSASNAADAETYIIPAIENMNVEPYQFIVSHSHSDHVGGLARLTSRFPNARIGMLDPETAAQYSARGCVILRDGDVLLKCIKILNLPGHTPDSLGLADMRTKTLISNDCLQLCGVGRYGTGITDAKQYFETLSRLMLMDIENIIASHDYVPLGYLAMGKANSKKYITECVNYAQKLQSFVSKNKNTDIQTLTSLYNFYNSSMPPVPESTIKAFCKLS